MRTGGASGTGRGCEGLGTGGLEGIPSGPGTDPWAAVPSLAAVCFAVTSGLSRLSFGPGTEPPAAFSVAGSGETGWTGLGARPQGGAGPAAWRPVFAAVAGPSALAGNTGGKREPARAQAGAGAVGA